MLRKRFIVFAMLHLHLKGLEFALLHPLLHGLVTVVLVVSFQ